METSASMMKWMAKNRGRKKPRKHPRVDPPVKREERAYAQAMQPYLRRLKELVDVYLLRQIPYLVSQFDANRPNVKRDAVDDDIASAMKQVRLELTREFSQDELKRIAQRRGISVSQLNEQFLEKGVKSVLDVDVFASYPWLSDQIGIFSTQNAQLITSMGDEYLNKVEKLAYSGLTEGLRVEEIEESILDQIDPSIGNIRSRAELIARDQVGKLNGQLTELRQTEIGVERYIWRTAGDGRVRDWHQDLEGEIFRWDDPPITNSVGDRNHPGGDYQCRCWAEPILSDLVEGVDQE